MEKINCWGCKKEFEQLKTEYDNYYRYCPLCEKPKREKDEADDLERRVYFAREQVYGNCPVLYKNSEESRFPSCWSEIKMWKPIKLGKGLLLKGETGKCKTRMLWKLALNLSDEGFKSLLLNETELADEVGDSFRAGKYHGYMKKLLNTETLIIDDLGKAKMTDRTVATIYRIVEDRTANGLPILASTNLTGEELSEKMGDETGAIVRRLKEFCIPILC